MLYITSQFKVCLQKTLMRFSTAALHFFAERHRIWRLSVCTRLTWAGIYIDSGTGHSCSIINKGRGSNKTSLGRELGGIEGVIVVCDYGLAAMPL